MNPAVPEHSTTPTIGSGATPVATRRPTHLDLPDRDGAIVENFQQAPQSNLLTGCLMPRLWQLHPDGRFAIGRDSGIYWRLTEPPLDGCRAPDFFVVRNVEPMLGGLIRRSYVMWVEVMAPLLVIEYVSGDGREERDRTPFQGKHWIYEQAVRADYYVIFDGFRGLLEVHRLSGHRYRAMEPNANGRFPVAELGVELGLWRGRQETLEGVWLRPWDVATGEMMPCSDERAAWEQGRAEQAERRAEQERQRADEQARQAEQERQRAAQADQRAEQERQRADRLAERLRLMNIDPESL